jgi:hypothetical protein
MKIKIGPYTSWFGPYQLADALCFWVKKTPDEYGIKSKPEWVHSFGEWLAHGVVRTKPKVGDTYKWDDDNLPETWLYKFLLWIDKKKTRKVNIKIDKYDTWSMDHTLALIIVPMLKQLRDTKHGSPYVELEDVPEHLRPDPNRIKIGEDGKPDKWDPDDNTHIRWDWVLNEMIYAFECDLDENWESQFNTGEHDIYWEKQENGLSEMKHGPNDTFKVDYDSLKTAWARRDNGRRLFAKYYHNLWD